MRIELADAGVKGVLLVYDEWKLDHLKGLDAERRKSRCRQLLIKLLQEPGALEVIFLTDDEKSLEQQLQRNPSESETSIDLPDDGLVLSRTLMTEVRLKPLNDDGWRSLLSRYDRVPVDELDLRCLTGGLVGLSIRLLDLLRANPGPPTNGTTIQRARRWAHVLDLANRCDEVKAARFVLWEFLDDQLDTPVTKYFNTLGENTGPPQRNVTTASYDGLVTTLQKLEAARTELEKKADDTALGRAWDNLHKCAKERGLPPPAFAVDRQDGGPDAAGFHVRPLLPFLQ